MIPFCIHSLSFRDFVALNELNRQTEIVLLLKKVVVINNNIKYQLEKLEAAKAA